MGHLGSCWSASETSAAKPKERRVAGTGAGGGGWWDMDSHQLHEFLSLTAPMCTLSDSGRTDDLAGRSWNADPC